MNAFRNCAGIVVIGALAWTAGALTPAIAQGGHAHGGGAMAAHGAHFAPSSRGGAHFTPRSSFAYGGRGAYSPRVGAYAGRAVYGGGAYWRGGYGRGPYWRGGYARGPYWGGGFYGARFAWFLPILPAFYATYWFGGIPYYYANDAYYTWDPGYSGYVATDPPADAVAAEGAPVPSDSGSAPATAGDVYLYPKNGQTDEQQGTDRYECHRWASSQTGFDPTSNAGSSAPGSARADYRRAMAACLEGRGYSVK
jgi:hypothetical protein